MRRGKKMTKHKICYNGFEAIGDKILHQNIIYFPDGSSQFKAAKIIIRDFDNCNSNNSDKDIEFNNIEKAWEYFITLDNCRVMDITGSIYIDTFKTRSKK